MINLSYLQEAQQLTEQTVSHLPQSERYKTFALEDLAKKIIVLFAKNLPEQQSFSVALPELGSGMRKCRYTTQEYAQKCVLTYPFLFPYFAQIIPNLSDSLEHLIDTQLEEISKLNSVSHCQAIVPLCKSLPATGKAMGMLFNKIEEQKNFHLSKRSIYSSISSTFDVQDQLIEYILNAPNPNPYITIRTARALLDPLEPKKIFSVISAFTKSQGWGCFPAAIEKEILEMNVFFQGSTLRNYLWFLNEMVYANLSLKAFSFLASEDFIWNFLQCDTLEVMALVEKILDTPNSDLFDSSDKECLLSKILQEPDLIRSVRTIKCLLDVGGLACLKKEIVQIASFEKILRASCFLEPEHLLRALSFDEEQVSASESKTTTTDHQTAEIASNLLKCEGFKKDELRDKDQMGHYYKIREGQTIGEVQGTTLFCKNVIQWTKETPSVLSPSCLRTLETITGLILRLKRLGHAFNLKGMVHLPNDDKVCLEGFNETFVIPMLRDMFDEFTSTYKNIMSLALTDFVKESLTKAIWHDNASDEEIEDVCKRIHNPEYDYPVIVGSGWIWHSTQVIFYRGYLYYCNRGADCGQQSGVAIFKIGNKDKITPVFLKGLTKRLSLQHCEYISLNQIKKELELVDVDYIPMKEQKVGNCVYANAKAAILTLLLLGIAKENPESTSLFNNEDKENAVGLYKDFSCFDKERVLEDFLKEFQKDKNWIKNISTVTMAVKEWAFRHLREKKNINGNVLSKTLLTIYQNT